MSDTRSNHRVAYFNGKIVPEREVVVPFRDRGFKYGDAAFDMTRTFHGRPFKLKEHVERLYRSLRYLRIDPGLGPAEMVAVSEEVLERNRHFLTPDTDYWLAQRVSRGVDAVGDEGWDHTGPTVIVECLPLPLKARARLFRDGIDIIVPPTRRVAPEALSPARQDAQLPQPDHRPISRRKLRTRRRGRCCSTRRATSPRASAATSSSCRAARS